MRKGMSVLGRATRTLVALATTAALLGGGCAGDKGDLNLVQPAYVTKADFLKGSWYFRRTVVDAPEAMAPYASIGTGDLFTIERIRWEITEDYLFAYRDYEYVPGTEGADLAGSDYHGTPVAAYPITKHFDIKRRYNETTGEETNIIEENDKDRVWHERTYMRVDWHINNRLDVGDLWILPVDWLDTDGNDGGAFYVHEDDVTNPFRARIEPDKGYVDFVTNHFVDPDWQTCYVEFDFLHASCGAGEIKIRNAFMRVDEDVEAGYQPLWYPDSVPVTDADGNEIHDPQTGEVQREPIFERFGYYRLEKLTYDNERELTESGRLYRIIRFDIWERSLDEQGNEIPYTNRTPKKVQYYLNAEFPDDLKNAAQAVAEEWNTVLKNAVASAQGKPADDVPVMFEIKENPCSVANVEAYFGQGARGDVRKRVETAVGKPLDSDSLLHWCAATEYYTKDRDDRFEWPQIGDPRYNMLYWIPNVVPSAFAGYGPMLGDPISGRNVTSTAYVMGTSVEYAATLGADYIEYMLGNLSLYDIIGGEDVPRMLTANDYDPEAHTYAMESTQTRALGRVSDEHLHTLEDRFQRLGGTEEKLLVPLANSNHFQERLERVAGTSLEREHLLRPEDIVMASRGQWLPGMETTEALLSQASHIKRAKGYRDRIARTERFMQQHTFCPLAELDGALVGLKERLKTMGSRAERRNYIREQYFKAVALHEIGHNMGLRHNFQASYDALNYHRDFWEMEATYNNDADPVAAEKEKEKAGQPEFRYSSIMDYHGKINADFQGLGKYDNAAIKFGYGQHIETFVDKSLAAGADLRQWRFENDYRKLAEKLGGVDAMSNREDLLFDWRNGFTKTERDDLTRHEVPYLFCSDEYSGYIPTCSTFDFGANHREIFWSSYVKYKNYFIFSNYLRNRLTINWNATWRGYNVFRNVVSTYQYMYLYRSLQEKMFGGGFLDTDLAADMATAVAEGINMMAEVIAWPDPAYYHRCEDKTTGRVTYYPDGYIYYDPIRNAEEGEGPYDEVCDMVGDFFPLRTGEAQPLFLDFTQDFVAWTFTYLGTYWDKMSAIEELVDPFARFFRVNDIEDYRAFSVSPYRLYEPEILGVYSNLIRYDRHNLASLIDPVGRKVVPRSVVPVEQPLGSPVFRPDGQSNLPLVFPAMARNLQRYGVLYGMALLTSPLDDVLDFSKRTRVTLKGAYDDFGVMDNPPDGLDVAECSLPYSGLTYRAMQVRDGVSIAYDMVQECAVYAVEMVKAKAIMDDPANQGNSDVLDDAERRFRNAERDLARVEQTLEFSRLVHLIYEHGAEL